MCNTNRIECERPSLIHWPPCNWGRPSTSHHIQYLGRVEHSRFLARSHLDLWQQINLNILRLSQLAIQRVDGCLCVQSDRDSEDIRDVIRIRFVGVLGATSPNYDHWEEEERGPKPMTTTQRFLSPIFSIGIRLSRNRPEVC